MTELEALDAALIDAHWAYLRACWAGDETGVADALAEQDGILEQRLALMSARAVGT